MKPPKAAANPVGATALRAQRRLLFLAAASVLTVGIVFGVAFALRPGSEPGPTQGLPDTPDYHSLLVSPDDPQALVLGTHAGLYRSGDGGLTWTKAELDGQDAMNLARSTARTMWAAGHEVLAKSVDGGATWQDVRPAGLPGLDIHGFAVDPSSPERVYAAVAGRGLYRSDDGGDTFSLVSEAVGPGVMALGVLADRSVLAADMQTGAIQVSTNGGVDWTPGVAAEVVGLAVNPRTPGLVLASGRSVLRSTDGGQTWKQALSVPAGTGPIAWSASRPNVAYVVGFDRSLWRSDDFGATWAVTDPARG